MDVMDAVNTCKYEEHPPKPKAQINSDIIMTSSTTSVTSSLSSPVDSGVQLLDSESEATSIMSVSGTAFETDSFNSGDTAVSLKQLKNEKDVKTIPSPQYEEHNNKSEKDTIEYQLEMFDREFGIAGLKDYFLSNKPSSYQNISSAIIQKDIGSECDKKQKCDTRANTLLSFLGNNGEPKDLQGDTCRFLSKSLSDDVFEMEHPIQGKSEANLTDADLMNVSLTSYELLDYTSQNLQMPVVNDQMNVSMSEEVNENLCAQFRNNFQAAEENIVQQIPVIEPEAKLVEEQIVYRRQRKKKSKSDTPKKRVSFHEDILNSTKIDDIHINHGFITHEPCVSLSFFRKDFVRKPDVVKGRYSWAAEGDAPYYEKQPSNRQTNSDLYVENSKYSSTSSSSTGSISSSIDEEDSSDENLQRKNPASSKPKSSCLKKTANRRSIDTNIVQEEINIPRQKSDSNLLDTNIFGSLKNILTFSTSVPLAERGVPEGQEDVPEYSNEKSSRRRSCTNFSFLDTECMIIKDEPVKRRGNLNLEVAKSSFRLSRSEGFYPNYPVEQQLPANIILCDSNVYEHKGISYSYEYDNFQRTFEQQNKPKSSTLYQKIMKEFNLFKKKAKEDPTEKEAKEELEAVSTSTPVKNMEVEPETKTNISTNFAAPWKLDWSDSEATVSEFTDVPNSRHLNSPKRKVNRSNHYSVQSSFKVSSDADSSSSSSFLFKNETVSRPSTSKSSLIDRFLRNVTMKKILDAKSVKRRKEERKLFSLYVKNVKGKFTGYDEIDRRLEKEIADGLEKKHRNARVYDKKMIVQLKREVFRNQLESFVQLFMVRSVYNVEGESKPLHVILTDSTLYIVSLGLCGRFEIQCFLSYPDLCSILIGPNAQTIHLSNFQQDMQFMMTTGCSAVTNEFVGQLEMIIRKSNKKMNMPLVKQLSMQDMSYLRRAICKQTAIDKNEEYVYYSIVDIQELGVSVDDATPLGQTKEGPLMFKTLDLNSRWETAYFILKGGVLYMLSSAAHKVPMKVFPLINGACQGARRLFTSQRPHTFQIVVSGKTLQLAAPDEYVASDWLQALIHAANGTSYKEQIVTQSCSLLMTTEHILTVRESFPCKTVSVLSDNNDHQTIIESRVLSCAEILDLVSFRLPSTEQSWCILEFSCREVYECGGDWILYFSSNSELENFISTLEVFWEYNNEKGESFPLSTIPETDPLSRKCVDVYMALQNSWSSNTVHLQFL